MGKGYSRDSTESANAVVHNYELLPGVMTNGTDPVGIERSISDPRIDASVCWISAVVMLFYLSASLAAPGRAIDSCRTEVFLAERC